ncbi:putative RNA helicase [Seiridium cardinale]|uniref:RNA helicase n=1 Tax=Seiridium cardinale TaxID=138064 RepID=A0ABR2Y603_9PEZI
MITFRKTAEEWAKNLEDGEINPVSGQPFSSRYYGLLEGCRKLPVAQHRGEPLDMYHANQVMVVVSEAGSGKTTQLAQYVLYDEIEGEKQIAVTQPRRSAARSSAEPVALEADVELDEEVGSTTDGLILHGNSNDVRFSRYDCIIIDEAHERSLATDTLLVFLKRALQLRSDLTIIIMSAILDAEKFQAYSTNASGKPAPLLKISGRQHQIKELFLGLDNDTSQQEWGSQTISPPDRFAARIDYFDMALNLALSIHTTMPEGTIVVFLGGEEEVERCRDALSSETSSMNILPIYGSLPKAQQDLMFQPSNLRKCILTTNIAETSLTIPDAVYVIDTRFAKQMPGILGHDPLALDFIDAPALESMLEAFFELKDMKLVERVVETAAPATTKSIVRITSEGKRAAVLPVEPHWYRGLAAAKSLGCLEDICPSSSTYQMLAEQEARIPSKRKASNSKSAWVRNRFIWGPTECVEDEITRINNTWMVPRNDPHVKNFVTMFGEMIKRLVALAKDITDEELREWTVLNPKYR